MSKTNAPRRKFLGSAAAVGAGISMGFTEAAHDDGVFRVAEAVAG